VADGVVLDPGEWILKTAERVSLDPVEEDRARLLAARPILVTGPPPLLFEAVLTDGAPAELKLEVFDVRGRLVAVPFLGFVGTGRNRLSWDGLTRDGGRAPSGVYLARVSANRAASTLRLVLAR
jgi:hypothetical protein